MLAQLAKAKDGRVGRLGVSVGRRWVRLPVGYPEATLSRHWSGANAKYTKVTGVGPAIAPSRFHAFLLAASFPPPPPPPPPPATAAPPHQHLHSTIRAQIPTTIHLLPPSSDPPSHHLAHHCRHGSQANQQRTVRSWPVSTPPNPPLYLNDRHLTSLQRPAVILLRRPHRR